MLFAAYIHDFSLYILCSCARRTGGRSYTDVTRTGFGVKAEILTSIFLCILLCLMLVAYMVLVKDIWTPIMLFLFPQLENYISQKMDPGATHEAIIDEAGPVVLALILFLNSPLLLKRDLYALRHTCYVGFASLVILTIALIFKAYYQNVVVDPTMFEREVKWFSWDIGDWIFAFPIIGLSFMSTYNVLSVHGSLVDPTRKRIKTVLDASIILCFCFFTVVGLCGYMYAYSNTQGNILLNFPLADKAILLGRLGYGFTLMFGLPLVTLPNREALLSIPDQWAQLKEDEKKKKLPSNIVNGVDFDEETPLAVSFAQNDSKHSLTYSVDNEETRSTDTFSEISQNETKAKPEQGEVKSVLKESHFEPLRPPTIMEYIIHFSSTAIIVIICYVFAVGVPSVAVVWSICGSSMAIIVSFILPTMCYAKIRAKKGFTRRMIGSWLLLIFSVIAAIVCTTQTLMRM